MSSLSQALIAPPQARAWWGSGGRGSPRLVSCSCCPSCRCCCCCLQSPHTIALPTSRSSWCTGCLTAHTASATYWNTSTRSGREPLAAGCWRPLQWLGRENAELKTASHSRPAQFLGNWCWRGASWVADEIPDSNRAQWACGRWPGGGVEGLHIPSPVAALPPSHRHTLGLW